MTATEAHASVFRAVGNPIRLVILQTIGEHGTAIPKDLQTLVSDRLGAPISQSALSQQLRVLKDSEMIKFRKDRQNVIYSLNEEMTEIVSGAMGNVGDMFKAAV